MSAPGTTPGKWYVGPSNTVLAHDPEDPDMPWAVADVGLMCGYTVQDEANANLIAASPNLYESLSKVLKIYLDLAKSGDCGFWNPEEETEIIEAHAALAKAKGQSS